MTKFDELNKLTSWEELNRQVGMKRSLPFRQYFGEMGISHAEMRRRGVFAEKLEDEIIFLLAFLFYAHINATGLQNIPEFQKNISDAYLKAYGKEPDQYILQRAETLAVEIMLTTVRHPDEAYYYSADRARLIAEEEANNAINYAEYNEAVDSGKHTKTWHTMADDRVRGTHIPLNGETIPIDALFEVGDSLMRFPKDLMYDPDWDEVANCRCWLTFSKE